MRGLKTKRDPFPKTAEGGYPAHRAGDVCVPDFGIDGGDAADRADQGHEHVSGLDSRAFVLVVYSATHLD